jgi:transcriptional regulator with XRE-family HTH domain
MTQAEVAKAAGISQPTYQNYEAGTITIPQPKLKRLARALKMGPDEILRKPHAVVYAPTVMAKPRIFEVNDGDDDPNGFEIPDYYGEMAIHFAKGNPIVLSITYGEYNRVHRDLFQNDRPYFAVFALSNQIVGVRRAAVTDISFAAEHSGSLGFEHDLYRELESEIVPGVWSEAAEYWDIVEVVACPNDRDREDVVKQYGELRVLEVERDIGLHMPDEIDDLIASGKVLADERQAELDKAEARLAKARKLGADIKWQLSNGKVRQETAVDDEDLVHFWWIADCAPAGEIIFSGADDHSYWINPAALDYISIPAHKFYVVNDKAEEADRLAFEKATAKRKRGG